MAYILMALILLAYKVMAHIRMPYMVMSHIVVSSRDLQMNGCADMCEDMDG